MGRPRLFAKGLVEVLVEILTSAIHTFGVVFAITQKSLAESCAGVSFRDELFAPKVIQWALNNRDK